MNYRTLALTALVACTAVQSQADTFVTITPTGSTAATVANRWAIGSDLSGLGYIDGNSGFPSATATNFFTINGAAILPLGNPTGFTSYLPTGFATPQSSVGNAMTPNAYSGLTYVAADLGLIGPLSFYAIHHRLTGDYLALIQPGSPTISDQKPMSAPGGPLTPGATGYFALSYAEDDAGGWGANLFYYLRTNSLGETVFGSLIPALGSGPTDRWNLGAGRGYTDLAYTSTNVGFGFGPSQFYYLRLDPLTQTTFFGRINPLTGVATDIQDLGGVYRTLVFTPTNVAYGANLFYSIGRLAQTITFAPLAGHTACDAPFTFVYPTASSGLPVTLTVSGPATVSGGNVVTLTGATGTVVLTASQAGNGTFAPAPIVTQSFSVGACVPASTPQTITFAPLAGHTACDAPFTFVYPTASSGLPVTLAVSGPATVSGGNVVTLTGATGTVVLTASQAGNGTFAPAPIVTQSFSVGVCVPTTTPQTITFAPVPDRGLCDGPFTVSPTASSGLPVTLTVTSGPATVSGNTVTLTGVGSVTLLATQAGNGTYAAAVSVSRTFAAAKCAATITLDHLTKTYYGVPFNVLDCVIATTTPAGLPVIITYNGSTTLPAAVGTYTVVATIDSPTYAGTVTGTFVVNPDARLAQTLSFGSPTLANRVFGDAPFTLNPTSSSGLPTTLAVTSGPATVSGNTVTLTGVGTVVLELTQSGHIATYLFASLSQSFVVAKATALITLSNLSHVYDGTPKNATAVTTPAALPVLLTYNGSSTAPSAAGSYLVQATINHATYQGSASATLTIAALAPPVITPPAATPPPVTATIPPALTFISPVGDIVLNQPINLGATTTSNLPINYSVVSGNATVSGSVLTITGTGPVIVRAAQPGNTTTAASSVDVTFNAQQASQSISFPTVGDQLTTGGTVTLASTANSGLPVSYTLMSGPATLTGNTLTFTGAAGTVIVRASQAGNATFNAAPDSTLAFNVRAAGQQVYFGQSGTDVLAATGEAVAMAFSVNADGSFASRAMSGTDVLAATISADNQRGLLLTRDAATGEAVAINFNLNADGSFAAAATSSTGATRPISGRVLDGVLTGRFTDSGVNFSAQVQSATGPTAAFAGAYTASTIGSSSGITYVIGGSNGQSYALTMAGTTTSAGMGTFGTDGSFNVQVSPTGFISGTTGAGGGLSGTISAGNRTAAFAGLSAAVERTDRMINLSARMRVVDGDASRSFIAGFVINGTTPKQVLVRAVGPGLTPFGIQNALTNPSLRVYGAGGQMVASNDDWNVNADVSAAANRLGAFALSNGSTDAAVLVTLEPGAYSAQVMANGGSGIALLEVYDAGTAVTGQQLVNLSSRGFVDPGEGALTVGFVVAGNAPKRVLIRGIGPALAQFGVPGTLVNPTLKVYSSTGAGVALNDDWATAQTTGVNQLPASAAEVEAASAASGAFPLPAGSKDAAIVITLMPGQYTATVTGAGDTTGAAMVEVYQLPAQ